MTTHSTWFITGASSGFGRALTELLLARGNRVAATVRDETALDDLRERYGGALWTARLDVTDGAAIRDVIARAFASFGRIDVIVNNAAYALFGAVEEATDDEIARQLRTNLVGSIDVIRAALPYLREQGGGRILQISSEGGQVTYPSFGYYHATKWALEGFVETLAREVAPLGIACTIVEPGATKTNFSSGLVHARAMAAYDATPAGDVRRAVANGTFPIPGDVAKMAIAIADVAERTPAPLRLALGSDAYAHIHASLLERLAELEAHRETSLSTDAVGAS